MGEAADPVEARIAANLKARREELGLSMAQLAERSGVSKAMIAKVESGASSPTAGLLGRLCAGLGVTLSSLMLSAESAGVALYGAASQPVWRDRETGLERTLIAPAAPGARVQVARVRLRPATVIEYPLAPSGLLAQHLLMESGALTFTIGGQPYELLPGDCLFALIDRPTRFETAVGAEYLVIQEQR